MPRLFACAFACFGLSSAVFAEAPANAHAETVTIQLSVTKAGFEPARVTVKRGVPLKLVITRKTNATCAREIVIKDHGVNSKLPLNKPVEVVFTPAKSGEIQYACAMDMIRGVVLVE